MLTFAAVFVACQGVAAARQMVEKQAEQQWDELEKLNKNAAGGGAGGSQIDLECASVLPVFGSELAV